jgi:hypothetical protein
VNGAVNRPFNCGSLTFLNSQHGTALALAPPELVGVAETGRARLACQSAPKFDPSYCLTCECYP